MRHGSANPFRVGFAPINGLELTKVCLPGIRMLAYQEAAEHTESLQADLVSMDILLPELGG